MEEQKKEVEVIIEESPTFRMEIKDGKIFKALSDFQGKAEMPQKTATNPFYKSKYAPLDVCLTQNQVLLQECGLAVTQFPYNDGAKIGIISILTHVGGEYIRSEYSVMPDKNTPQGLGSAITYLRRYSFSAITGTAAEDDDDGNSQEGDSNKKPDPKKPAAKTQNALTEKQIDEKLKKIKSENDLNVFWRNSITPEQAKKENLQKKFKAKKEAIQKKKIEDAEAEAKKNSTTEDESKESTDIVSMMIYALKSESFDRDIPLIEEEIEKCEKQKKDAYVAILQVKLKDIGKSDYVPNVTPF